MGQQYPLTHTLGDEAKAALVKFARRSERSTPMKFIGRKDLLAGVEGRISDLGQEDQAEPNAMLVMGPPGAGKTSLIREMARRNNSDLVHPVLIQGDTFSTPAAFAAAFVEAGGGDTSKLGEETHRETRGKVGAGGLASLGHTNRTVEASMNERLQQGNTVWSAVASSVKLPLGTVFLVLVDEAQGVRPIRGEENPILKNLLLAHTGPLKCVSVFAGLMDTDNRLDEAGGSPRLPHEAITLGPYTTLECDQATQAFFAHEPFDLDDTIEPRHQRAMRRDIRIAGEQYPRHVHCYLSALAGQLGEGRETIDWDAVLDEGHRRRILYSARLLSQERHRPLGRTMRHLAKNASESERISHGDIARTVRSGKIEGDADTILAQAIHRGVLAPVPKKVEQYQFPLPSMHTYLCHDDEDDCLAAMREDCQRRVEREGTHDS